MYDMVIADAISLAVANFELGYEEDEKEAAYNELILNSNGLFKITK